MIASNPHTAVLSLREDEAWFQINPSAYQVRAVSKARISESSALSVVVNYSWLGQPIGWLSHMGKDIFSLPPFYAERPVLVWDRGASRMTILTGDDYDAIASSGADTKMTALQAGPFLVRSSKIPRELERAPSQGVPSEFFRPDAVRVADHVAVGVTKAGKLLVGWTKGLAPVHMARRLLDLGAVDAMKCDGGRACTLFVRLDEKNAYRFGEPANFSRVLPSFLEFAFRRGD